MERAAVRALVLAGVQAVDLAVAQVSPRFGPAHLDHLGVPRSLRPVLPVVKAAAVVALVVTAKRPAWRSLVGAGLVSYYSSAATFHVLAGDRVADAAPAAVLAAIAGTLI